MPKIVPKKNKTTMDFHEISSSQEFGGNKKKNFSGNKHPVKRLDNEDFNMNGEGDSLVNQPNEDMNVFLNQYVLALQNKKKKRIDVVTTEAITSRQKKFSEYFDKQLEIRKESRSKLASNLAAVLEQMETDSQRLQDHEQRLLKLLASQSKAAEQVASAHAQRLLALKDMHAAYEKQSKIQDEKDKNERAGLEMELTREMKNLQRELLNNSRQEGLDHVRKALMHAMQSI